MFILNQYFYKSLIIVEIEKKNAVENELKIIFEWKLVHILFSVLDPIKILWNAFLTTSFNYIILNAHGRVHT